MFLIADPHIGNNKDTLWLEGVNLFGGLVKSCSSRMFDVLNRMKYVSDEVAKHNESLVILGDVFDISSPSSKSIQLFTAWLTYTLKKGVSVYIIPGNHDSTVDSINISMFNGFDSVVNNKLKIITEICEMKIDGIDVCFVPHIPRNLVTDEILEKIRKSKSKIFLGHGQVVGSKYDNECFYESGKALELRGEMFPEGVQVFLGHEHNYNIYNKGIVQFIYLGSVGENNYGEAGDKKGYIHFIKDHWDWYDYNMLKYSYLNLEIDLLEKDFTYTADDLREVCEGKLIKVKVLVKDVVAVNQRLIEKVISDAGGYVTKFVIDLVNKEMEEEKGVLNVNQTDSELLEEYLKEVNDINDVEREAIYKLGMSFIEGGNDD